MTHASQDNPEVERLAAEGRREPDANWKRWGPYLAERQWGTVREDYSSDGESWNYFTHDDSRSRAYRWGEDGILGITDRQCRLCFALALWNGRDPILKERLFGLTGPEGNHGEDVKEAYFYLDATPTHSYLKGLYKYPQQTFPYEQLREVNAARPRNERECELTDLGIFDHDEYFDVFVEYAKLSPEDIGIRLTVANRNPAPATLHMLPTLWFRNTWSWPHSYESAWPKPRLALDSPNTIAASHATLGEFQLEIDPRWIQQGGTWLFTENETNTWRYAEDAGHRPSCKDAFHLAIVNGLDNAVNVGTEGTKTCAHLQLQMGGNSTETVYLRLRRGRHPHEQWDGLRLQETFNLRIEEADLFYTSKVAPGLSDDEKQVLRQADAGLIWTKQFYYYVVKEWLEGDRSEDQPLVRHHPRNKDWQHLFNRDVISMPDKWEYPWYAAWDSAFHMIPFANLDANFAKEQLLLFLREWYMHPNGQMPAYEWNFGDVNPPVHAWASWRIYQMTAEPGQRDRVFLSRVFQKLLLNFTWWVNRKDVRGQHVFSGGFLGLDNIGIFDRSKPLPTGGHLEQADGTAWMAFYCSSMLAIAFELATRNPAYEDVASKFFEHYVAIAEAMNSLDGTGLWDEADGFYYDHLHTEGKSIPLRIRSMVGIIPLFTVDLLYDKVVQRLPGFKKRMEWLLNHRQDLPTFMTYMEKLSNSEEDSGLRLLAIPTRDRLERILKYVLDEDEFLSPFGVRSLSKYHLENPFVFHVNGEEFRVEYVPGESDSNMFGGNSNWRGPIWFPLNYLLIEAFERYYEFYGDDLKVECPVGSGVMMNLQEVADDLRSRLVKLFLFNDEGKRPCYVRGERFVNDPHWRDLILYYEYFHADTGRGLGASHQTGWTALVAPMLETLARHRENSV